MKICSVCLKSDILCPGCTKKLEKGMITKTDIEIERYLFKLGIETDFIRSVDVGTVFILATKAQASLLIGRAGNNAKRLGSMLGKSVRVIENTDDEKILIERILGVQVLGINKIYGARETYKIRLEKRTRFRVGDSATVGKIINRNVQFVFE
jgi:transcription antitermination factor NusA-like protein